MSEEESKREIEGTATRIVTMMAVTVVMIMMLLPPPPRTMMMMMTFSVFAVNKTLF